MRFRSSTRRSSAPATCCKSMPRIWRWSGTSRYQDRPLCRLSRRSPNGSWTTINAALMNIPRDRVRMHVCWGNYEGPHDCDVDLQDILPVIQRARVGGFVLPFANPRHAHEHRCLSDLRLSDDQVVVAGVIDPLTNFVEHPEVIADRIEQVRDRWATPRAFWPAPIAVSTPPPVAAGSRRTWSGRSCAPWPKVRGSPPAGWACASSAAARRPAAASSSA